MNIKKKLIIISSMLFVIVAIFTIFLPLFFLKEEIKEKVENRETFYKIIRKTQWQLTALGLIVLFSLLFIFWYLYRRFVAPLHQFTNAAQLISKGELEKIDLPKRVNSELQPLHLAFEKMIEGIKERENIRAILDKVVSKEVAEEILQEELHLGGEERTLTMLFSDVRDFTKITENLAPQKTIEILNLYMTLMSGIIEGEGGIIDKYVGDEIMALFGAPVYHEDHALRALSTGMLMIESLKKFNQERAQRGEPTFEMGIGIHTGNVVVGNMGAEARLNYTVIGRNVNLAARLCSIAEPGQLIISEFTYNAPNVRDAFHVKPLPNVILKGFSDPIKVFEIISFKWDTTIS